MTGLTITEGHWYGFTMWPGYTDHAYHSPIRIIDVRPVGNRRFELVFVNASYAAGAQDMTYVLQTLKRERDYILAALPDSDRAVAIEPLTMAWLGSHLPDVHQRVLDLQRELSSPEYLLAEWLKRQAEERG